MHNDTPHNLPLSRREVSYLMAALQRSIEFWDGRPDGDIVSLPYRNLSDKLARQLRDMERRDA